MASVLRTGLGNLTSTGLLGGLCKVLPKHCNVTITQVRSITCRDLRVGRPPKPAPFDWRRKPYNYLAWVRDPMEQRFDDNTKVIVVEGLPAVGKDKVARQLAEELDMEYIKPASFDEALINPYGFDLRTLNPKLPESAQFFDLVSFLEKPNGVNSAAMQLSMLGLRIEQYIDALVHVLSTGQGVVLQRSPFSDINFMQAMLQSGFVSKGAFKLYKSALVQILPELLRPHLVVYLDASVSTIKNNIKKRNCPYEVNSKALTEKYLQDLSDLYKEQYLREAAKHSHLLIYDWNTPGDPSIVVEDIECLDFETVHPNDHKFLDWRYDHIYTLKLKRSDYVNHKGRIMSSLNIANYDVSEMWMSADDGILLEQTLAEVSSETYAPGFNPEVDKGILFKLNSKPEDYLPRGQVAKQE